jgi:hypothetical protein
LIGLVEKISKLSKTDRNYLTISEVLDQPRVLLINFGNKFKITYDQLAYSLRLCTGVKFNIMSFMGENDEFMMQMVMSEAKSKVQGRIQNIWL